MANISEIEVLEARRRIEAQYKAQMDEVRRLEQKAAILKERADSMRRAALDTVSWFAGGSDDDKEVIEALKRDGVRVVERQETELKIDDEDGDEDDDSDEVELFRNAINEISATISGNYTIKDIHPLVIAKFPDARGYLPQVWSRAMRVLEKRGWIEVVEKRRGNVGSVYRHRHGGGAR